MKLHRRSSSVGVPRGRRSRLLGVLVAASLAGACAEDPPQETPTPPLTEPVGPCDVSILMPMPAPPDRLGLLGPDATGPKGEILPRHLYAELPALEKFVSNVEQYEMLRVVGIRLDPCFPTLDRGSATGCKSMVRLVLQPIRLESIDDQLALRAADIAVHLFYAVDEPELEELLAWLVDARKRAAPDAAPGPLGVHPALAAEGVGGQFMATLRGKLMAAIGEDNLTRVTVMALGDFGNVWTFAGFDVSDAGLTPFTISTISATRQKFTNTDSTGEAFVGGQFEPPAADADGVVFWLESSVALSAAPTSQLAAFEALVRIENPALENPDTIDCAACHVAPAARRWATTELGLDASSVADAYVGADGAPVAGATLARTDELRMFGYFDTRPSISQRTVNETDALVAFWNRELGLE